MLVALARSARCHPGCGSRYDPPADPISIACVCHARPRPDGRFDRGHRRPCHRSQQERTRWRLPQPFVVGYQRDRGKQPLDGVGVLGGIDLSDHHRHWLLCVLPKGTIGESTLPIALVLGHYTDHQQIRSRTTEQAIVAIYTHSPSSAFSRQ